LDFSSTSHCASPSRRRAQSADRQWKQDNHSAHGAGHNEHPIHPVVPRHPSRPVSIAAPQFKRLVFGPRPTVTNCIKQAKYAVASEPLDLQSSAANASKGQGLVIRKLLLIVFFLAPITVGAQQSYPVIDRYQARLHLLHSPTAFYQESPDRVFGDVILQIDVDRAGHVTKLVPVSGRSELVTFATRSVRLWTYAPFLINGSPPK
jgi:hypothetical protein